MLLCISSFSLRVHPLARFATVLQMYLDYLANPSAPEFANIDAAVQSMPRSKSLLDKSVEKAFVGLSSSVYKERVWPSTQCMRRLGNMYTASVYGGLASIIDSVEPEQLLGKRIALFSFGSGLAASFFAMRVRGDTKKIRETVNLKQRLAEMEVRPCNEFIEALQVRSHLSIDRVSLVLILCFSLLSPPAPQLREEKHNIKNYVPTGSPKPLLPGTYYLSKVDEMNRRFYSVKE